MTGTVDREVGTAVLEQIMDERWTCRQFRPEPVPRADIDRLLRLAQRTPSWCNTQPWHTVVTEGEGTARLRQALLDQVDSGGAISSDIAWPPGYEGVYQERRRECGMALYETLGITREDKLGKAMQMRRNFEFFDAPHVAIITTTESLGAYGAVDCGLYIGTFLLAAQSLGLGAAPQAALASYSELLHRELDIPADRHVVAGISFGYADADAPVNTFRTTRADLADAVTFVSD
ncbi:nitroreductase [Gordonia sp. SID5947]|uniref:nitroreductase n=1 Tax=Gordonia sp. SID5947 TaxID=2690315 RepID=UPI0013695446|nr:nitroreductase [Gordonia sp. SID5947]MYR08118.1 nitroreductase [Gordonia sp. SID5947]